VAEIRLALKQELSMSRFTDPTHDIEWPLHSDEETGTGIRRNTFSCHVRDADHEPWFTAYGASPQLAGLAASHLAQVMNAEALRSGDWNPHLSWDPLTPREEANVIEMETRRKTP
jgi:hypothetical protein